MQLNEPSHLDAGGEAKRGGGVRIEGRAVVTKRHFGDALIESRDRDDVAAGQDESGGFAAYELTVRVAQAGRRARRAS